MADETPPPATLSMLARFLMVGGGFALGYALATAVLVDIAGLPALPTSVGLYVICIPAAFWMQKRVTFRVARTRPSGFWIYAAMQIGCLFAIASVTTRFVTGDFILDTGLFLVTAGAAAGLSFVVSKLFAFRPG
ncbi:MAG: GtrA family protein [Pseudomonadota bacterium]